MLHQISAPEIQSQEITGKAKPSGIETFCEHLQAQTYFERLQEIGISRLHSIGPFSAFCIPETAPEGFPVIILYLQHITKIMETSTTTSYTYIGLVINPQSGSKNANLNDRLTKICRWCNN